MITQKDQEKQKIEKIQNGISICEDALKKAEKYERLKDNKDWQGFIEDLKILSTKHDNEIKMGEMMLIDAPHTGYLKFQMSSGDVSKQEYVSSREDWIQFILRHQIQKAQCETWTKETDRIINFAGLCREKLPQLKKELEDLTHEPVGHQGNGKS